MFDLVIFDCDGVLIDSEWLANRVEVEELANIGISISLEHYLDLALGRTNDEVEEALFAIHGLKIPCGFWHKVQVRQEVAFRELLTPIEGIEECLTNLEIPHCVASSSNSKRLDLTLRTTGLYPHFEGQIFGRECVRKGKPEPDIFLYASAKMGISPARCLVIEDSIHGINAANAAGMQVWAFCGGRHFSESRKKQLEKSFASLIFDDMRKLPSLVRYELKDAAE